MVFPQGQRHSLALPCWDGPSPSLPLHGRSGQVCGTHRHRPQGLFCIWILFEPVGCDDYDHCSTSPVLPCCQSILHPRDDPSYGLGEGGGCCGSAALLCFVLRVQLPKTQSHKTQFTIPAAFWHPSVLAYR